MWNVNKCEGAADFGGWWCGGSGQPTTEIRRSRPEKIKTCHLGNSTV